MDFKTVKIERREQKVAEADIADWFQNISQQEKYTTEQIKNDIIHYVGKSGYFYTKENDINYGADNRKVADIFLNTEKYLKNTEVFWAIAGEIWVAAGEMDKRWSEAWNRYDRRNLHINKRSQLFGSMHDKDGGKYAAGFLQNRNSKTALKVYRVFNARKGKRIRAGEVKTDEGYFVQEAGAGYSYTLSINVAASFSTAHLNTELFNRYSKLTKSEIKRYQETQTNAGFFKIKNFDDAYFIGKYEIRKQDIVGMFMQSRGELEVVSEKSKLIHYGIVSAETALAGFAYRQLEAVMESENQRVILFGREDLQLHNRLLKGARLYLKNHSYESASLGGYGNGFLDKVVEYAGLQDLQTISSANGSVRFSF
jgi:hypothetical protein